MKFNELKSIGHNIADSLACGIGLMIGVYDMDVFGEASASTEGFIIVDFLSGETTGAPVSVGLANAVRLYSEALSGLCERHGTDRSAFAALTTRYGVDAVYGGHFTVTVEDKNGRVSTDRYYGLPGRKLRRVKR